MIDRGLLHDFLREYPAQPATALWRAVEVGALIRFGIPGGRGLDLGCGDGKLTALIIGRVGRRQLVGADLDPLETNVALHSGLYEAVHTCPGADIPEADASFDFALSNSVLEHIPELEPVLHELGRLLRPGGRFLFTVPAPAFHANLRGSLFPWLSRHRYLEELDRRLAHLRYPSSSDWAGMCDRAGLRLDGCLGYLDQHETRAWETLSRFTGGLLYAVSGKRRPPIAIQRQLGLKQLQNKTRLPESLASVIGAAIMTFHRSQSEGWLPEETASCLLVHGTRP